jgi:hypothetical protein
MFRFLLPSALVLSLAGCSTQSASDSLTPVPMSDLTVSAVDQVGARQALIGFLEGYAGASQDDGAALRQAVQGGPPELSNWVHWLVVQNRSNPGELTGTVRIAGIRFDGPTQIQGTIPGAVFQLDAGVQLTYRPPDAAPVIRTHDFSGQALVFLHESGDWGIWDVTRDGQSMAESISLLDDVVLQDRDATLRIDSIFAFGPLVTFNVLVENRGSGAFTFDAERTRLTAPTGGIDTPPQSHTSDLDRIESGRRAAGTISFGGLSARPKGLVIAFNGGKAPGAELSISLTELEGAMDQGPPPTAAPGGGGPTQ